MGQRQRRAFSVNENEGVWFAVVGGGWLLSANRPGSSLRGVDVHEEEEGALKWPSLRRFQIIPLPWDHRGHDKPDQSGDVIYWSRVHVSRGSGLCFLNPRNLSKSNRASFLFLSHTHTLTLCLSFCQILTFSMFPQFTEAELHLRRIRRMFSASKHNTWGLWRSWGTDCAVVLTVCGNIYKHIYNIMACWSLH